MITDRIIKERIRNHGKKPAVSQAFAAFVEQEKKRFQSDPAYLPDYAKPMPTPTNPSRTFAFLNRLAAEIAVGLDIQDTTPADDPTPPDEGRLQSIEDGHLDPGPFQFEALPDAVAPINAIPAYDQHGKIVAWAHHAPYPRYPDLMIDIEGLANTPDSAPAQIALVFFDRDDASKQFCKYTYDPSPISAIRLGFNVTADTLKWWDDKGMTIDVQHGEPLPDVLDEIALDIQRHAAKNLRVWSRGNTYDLSILKLAYHRTGKPMPWHFQNEREVRTWLEGSQFVSPRKNDHDALQDACNQALDIIESTAPVPASTHHDSGGNPINPHTGTPLP